MSSVLVASSVILISWLSFETLLALVQACNVDLFCISIFLHSVVLFLFFLSTFSFSLYLSHILL